MSLYDDLTDGCREEDDPLPTSIPDAWEYVAGSLVVREVEIAFCADPDADYPDEATRAIVVRGWTFENDADYSLEAVERVAWRAVCAWARATGQPFASARLDDHGDVRRFSENGVQVVHTLTLGLGDYHAEQADYAAERARLQRAYEAAQGGAR